jgi:hypothetical protein
VFHFGEIIEGSGGGEEAALLSVRVHAAEEVGKAGELGMGAGVHEPFGGGGGEVFEALEAETECLVVEDEGFAGRMENGDWFGPNAVPAGVTEEGGYRVESHGLAVEQGAVESGWVVAFNPGGHIHQQRKTGGVGFRKTVTAETADLQV